MRYREMGKTGDKVSILGFGCMRLQRGDGRFDEKRAERLVRSAIDRGVNYLDTAYLYFGNRRQYFGQRVPGQDPIGDKIAAGAGQFPKGYGENTEHAA